MVLPFREERPAWKETGFREQMIEYIRHHFSDLLGEDTAWLDHADGLDRISAKYGLHGMPRERSATETAKPGSKVGAEQIPA